MAKYPRFIESAEKWLSEHPDIHVTREELEYADERFFRINQAYYDDMLLLENHLTTKSKAEITFEHTIRMQEMFEDTFGEDAWDDRHEIYTQEEG